MPLEAIKPKSITGLDTLDFDKRNYVRWSETALDAYLYAGTHEYVLGQIPKPATDSADYPIWTKNDNIAQAGIRMNISSSERDYLRDHCTIASANDIWKELKKHHREKASTQTSLLDDLLGIRIERGTDMVEAAGKVRDISKQVFETGQLDAEKLALTVLLRALSPELRFIRDKWEDDDDAKPSDIVKSLEKEKLRWDEEMKKTSDERANAARTQKTPPAKAGTAKGLCGTCSGKHRTDECWGEGGAMEGRRKEVLERRAARRKESEETKPASTPAPAKPAAKPRFAMKDASGKVVYFTMAEDEPETVPIAAAATIAAVTSDEELEKIYSTYHARRNSDASNTSEYSLIASISPPSANTPEYPYPLFANIERADITAAATVAKGEVHIRSDNGHVFILKNVFYVPDAALRLMSVGRVTDERYTAAFNSTEMILIHQDDNTNTVVLTASRRNKKLYAVNGTIIPPPSLSNAVHALAAQWIEPETFSYQKRQERQRALPLHHESYNRVALCLS
ncbi:hypothetical protein B0H14DRAFT_2618925 [Mycena olivaceomarginata]|nr:hypothetical protein B0H14DRAFT_2618925 [Mycena olivaceomarginata]